MLLDSDHVRSRLSGVGAATAEGSATGSSIEWAWGAEPAVACSAFSREVFGGPGITRGTQEQLERVPKGLDRPVKGRPRSFDLDGGFIDAPGVSGGFEVRLASLLQFWG